MDREKQTNLYEEAEQKRVEQLVAEVEQDFLSRREKRKSLERGWQLNMNFYSGNQYCDVMPDGEIGEEDARFYWQSRRVFNHIAPTIETRCAKLEKNRPSLVVKAFSNEEGDLKSARLASNVLKAATEQIGLSRIVSECTLWSEVCGSSFYKVLWSANRGKVISADGVKEGDVVVVPCSPFEIFPDSLSAERMEDVRSLIHAKALPVSEIEQAYGVRLAGHNVSEFGLSPYSEPKHWNADMGRGNALEKEGHELVIERYSRPCQDYPQGRLEIVAGGKLLYEGPLPYKNGDHGERVLPFVKQVALPLPGAFFGTSVVDRLIPLQRAYNAVRNRKHEFLNRLSMGVLTVEDGSTDTDELAEEGVCPGKILVYRQGSQPPKMLDCGNIPTEFEREEETLVNEFLLISGTSEITRDSRTPTGVTSATGIQLLLNQEDERLAVSAHSTAEAVREVARQILKLYKQFATGTRVLSMSGTGKNTEWIYFSASDLSTNDVQFETNAVETPEKQKAAILELLALHLLENDEGKLTKETKNKVLEVLGYGNMVGARDISALQIAKAEEENLLIVRGETIAVNDYDDDTLHYETHLRYVLSEEFSALDEDKKQRLTAHLSAHKVKSENKKNTGATMPEKE